ncbi:MAG: ACT domain-containing protein [Candidatus Thorarchaeota archaeon]
MVGEKDLRTLLRSMKPSLVDGEYVFHSLQKDELEKLKVSPLMTYVEKEGITVILDKQTAEASGISYGPTWALITLEVHSDLEAVGFMARLTTALAGAGISVNIVSAYYHDYLFVPHGKAQLALEVLEDLSQTA